jgi:hypothetical protein
MGETPFAFYRGYKGRGFAADEGSRAFPDTNRKIKSRAEDVFPQ